MLEELQKHIQNEIQKQQQTKQNIEQKIQTLPITLKKEKSDTSDNQPNKKEKVSLEEVLSSSKQSFIDISKHSQKIQTNVSQIQSVTLSALKDFEKLKYRKINTENLLNTLSAFSEFQKLIPDLQIALQNKQIDAIIKKIQTYNDIKDFLLQEYIAQQDQQQLESLIKDCKEFAKQQFEVALGGGDQDLLVKCTQLQKILDIQDTSLEKILESYSQNLQKQFREYEEEMFTNIPTNYECYTQFFVEGHYKNEFLEYFIKILSDLWTQFEQYNDVIYQYYGFEGIVQMLTEFVDKVAGSIVKSLFKKMNNFYILEKIDRKSITTKDIDLLHTYCYEVVQISNQNEQFNRELTKKIDQMEQNNEKKENKGLQIRKQIECMSISYNILELLGVYIRNQEIYLLVKISQILDQSKSFTSLLNQQTKYFTKYLNMEEPLYNISEICGFIDEIFYIVKYTAIQALETLNKNSACAVIQNISATIIHEKFRDILLKLIDKYLHKDFFTVQGICLYKTYTPLNSLVIILMNNMELSLVFIKKLNKALQQEVDELFTEQFENDTKKTITSQLEELEQDNVNQLSKLIKIKFKELQSLLSITYKDIIQEFQNINFSMNETLLMQYEQSDTFSQIFKIKMQQNLQQWKNQLTKDNFEIFMETFCAELTTTLENIIYTKKFHQLGGIFLDKEIRAVLVFLQNITQSNIKPIFKTLQFISEILMLENYEDVKQFAEISDISLQSSQMAKIIRLRIDFNIPTQTQ